MVFACPVSGCDYTADNVDQLSGHIGGKADSDNSHAEYGDIRRFELLECEIQSKDGMTL